MTITYTYNSPYNGLVTQIFRDVTKVTATEDAWTLNYDTFKNDYLPRSFNNAKLSTDAS